jgi:16S rRNA (guanine527-N7)-methyltransferase
VKRWKWVKIAEASLVTKLVQKIRNLLNVEMSQTQIDQLLEYVSLLKRYNQKLNLISRRDIQNVWENHIYPSLLANNFVDLPLGAAVADLGSGGGLPGIPLKLIRPDLNLVLIDSSLKKTAFLRQVIYNLRIQSAAVMQVRICPGEEVELLNQQFDVVLARAVAGFQELWGLAKPLLKQQGFLLSWKGKSDLPEIQTVGQKLAINYQILKIPESFWQFSEKFAQLCYVKAWQDHSKNVNDLKEEC